MYDYLNQIDLKKLLKGLKLSDNQLGKTIDYTIDGQKDMEDFDIAIASVCKHIENEKFIENIRQEFYQLFDYFDSKKIIDLGKIIPGESERDTEAAIKMLIEDNLENNIITIILADDASYGYAQFGGYRNVKHSINLVNIDECIAFDPSVEDPQLYYLNPIIANEPEILFNLSHLGHQQFVTNPKAADSLAKLNFDVKRLGEIKSDIEETEIFFRDAEAVLFNTSSIQRSDYKANCNSGPNGIPAAQVCQLSRYAGLSPKVSSFGFYNLNGDTGQAVQNDAQLIAQSMWYFIEGVCTRIGNDVPTELQEENFVKFFVDLKEPDHRLSFWKSKLSNRWWMAFDHDQSDESTHFVSCSYADYQKACQNELPDRWMKSYLKIY